MTQTLTTSLLALKHARVVYGTGVVGMERTSLSFNAGEFVVLLGPSGAGKSTLLRALNGLVQLTEGTLHSEGGDTISGRAALRAHRSRTAMVFQQHQLIGRLTALDNVLTGRLGHHGSIRCIFPLPRHDRLVALEALERVGLLDSALTRADQLSGGQQQRVGLARALAQEPSIILADEPVASLDPATARHVLSLIHSVCKAQGIAAVVSLHQVDLALAFADRIVGVRAGQTVFDGPPCALDETVVQHIYNTKTQAQHRATTVALAA
ncbi:MAG: phosphonate/organophosphate ester transporter subunit [Pseudomonadota bacterium]|jgi:phosphonate transport system ATP-binding protein